MQYKKDRSFVRNRVVNKAVEKKLEIYFEELTIFFTPERGKRVAHMREKAKMSQVELAKILGLTQTDVHRLEHGMLTTIPLTAAQFRSALPDHFTYILLGHRKEHYEKIKVPSYKELKEKRRQGKI